jgi:hypothetical protein
VYERLGKNENLLLTGVSEGSEELSSSTVVAIAVARLAAPQFSRIPCPIKAESETMIKQEQ